MQLRAERPRLWLDRYQPEASFGLKHNITDKVDEKPLFKERCKKGEHKKQDENKSQRCLRYRHSIDNVHSTKAPVVEKKRKPLCTCI